jgi:hypothetical protein
MTERELLKVLSGNIVYELLKSPDIMPDNVNPFLEKYTEDIYTAINNVHDTYLSKLKKKQKHKNANIQLNI